MEDYFDIKISVPLRLAILFVIFMTASTYPPFGLAWLKMLTSGLAFVCLIFAIFTGGNWILHVGAARMDEINRAANITAKLLELLAAGKLSAEQAAAFPTLVYADELEMVDDEGGPIFSLKTPAGPAPLIWAEKFLRDSTKTDLPSIRNAKTDSTEQIYLKRFISWAVYRGLALEPVGPYPATWIDDVAREKAFRRLGLKEYKEL